MTGETENPALGLLGGRRAGVDRRVTPVETRLTGPRLEGWRGVFVATNGSLVTDTKDHDTRIAAVEGAPA